MSCALEKIIMVEVNGHIQSQICGNIIVFQGMFMFFGLSGFVSA